MVRNCLAENNLRAHRPHVRTVLTDHHHHDRLQWADRHINWTRQDWRTLLLSDDSRFALSNSDGRIRVYRLRGERHAVCCILQRDRFGGGGSMMVWAGIGYGYCTRLVVIDGSLNAQKYKDHDLAPHIVPLIKSRRYCCVSARQRQTSHRPLQYPVLVKQQH